MENWETTATAAWYVANFDVMFRYRKPVALAPRTKRFHEDFCPEQLTTYNCSFMNNIASKFEFVRLSGTLGSPDNRTKTL